MCWRARLHRVKPKQQWALGSRTSTNHLSRPLQHDVASLHLAYSALISTLVVQVHISLPTAPRELHLLHQGPWPTPPSLPTLPVVTPLPLTNHWHLAWPHHPSEEKLWKHKTNNWDASCTSASARLKEREKSHGTSSNLTKSQSNRDAEDNVLVPIKPDAVNQLGE